MPLHFIQKHPKAKALSTFTFSRSQGAALHLLFTQRGQLSVTSSATVCNTASQMLILNVAVLTKSIVRFTKTQTPVHSQQEKPCVLVILEVFSKKQSVAMVMRYYH